jgi:uracil-DNA glycosylase
LFTLSFPEGPPLFLLAPTALWAILRNSFMLETSAQLRVLNEEIVSCRQCPRLVKYRERVAREKRHAYREWEYWGKPVPGFGDAQAQLLILGLAPAAHGANRTGRMFTGDRSGDFLYAALHKAGFANQFTSRHRDDGLQLISAYITATCRCAPPENKPHPREILNCRTYLESEIEILKPKAVLALGKIAWDGYLDILKRRGAIVSRAPYKFAHGAEAEVASGTPRLFGVYHPSQQNTQTGRVTPAMYAKVLARIRRFLEN